MIMLAASRRCGRVRRMTNDQLQAVFKRAAAIYAEMARRVEAFWNGPVTVTELRLAQDDPEWMADIHRRLEQRNRQATPEEIDRVMGDFQRG